MATTNTSSTSAPALTDQSQVKLIHYVDTLFAALGNNTAFRNKLLRQDLQYYRELDRTTMQARTAAANTAGDPTKVQNVTIPVVGPQVDSATSYFVEMFLTSYPIFPVVTSPELVDVGLMLETLLGQSSQQFQWARHIAMCFRDGLKYNFQAAEVEWTQQKFNTVINDEATQRRTGKPQETVFEGNRIRRLSPYNTVFDPRVPITEVHQRGEFVGYTDLITRIELKQLFLDLDSSLTMNATKAFQSGTATVSTSNAGAYHYIPEITPEISRQLTTGGGFNWLGWANLDTQNKIRYSDMYEKTVLYLRIIPKEFFISPKGSKPAGDPHIYKLIVINRKVIIFAQRQTNAHNMLPIIIGQMNEDGHGLQTKSYADNAAPYQTLATSLYNSAIHSQRRKVYDRLLYDPSRVNKADIDKVDPVARIAVKQEAYGKPLSESVYQIPYRDEGVANILGMAREIVDMADVSTGQNRAQRGQFQKGNKTRHEFDTVMGNSDARPRTSAVLMGVGWFGPIKDILKLNILQYQPPAELFNQVSRQSVKIKPDEIRKLSWEFQLADGIMPSDHFLSFDLFGQVLQYAGMNPAAAAEWDLTGMFAYQLKAQGARWVDNFRRTPDQQKQFLQQSAAAAAPQPPALPAPTGPVQ